MTTERHNLPGGASFPTARSAAELEQILRYGQPTRGDLLAAASVLSAYNHLLSYELGVTNVIKKLRVLFRMERALPPELEDEE